MGMIRKQYGIYWFLLLCCGLLAMEIRPTLAEELTAVATQVEPAVTRLTQGETTPQSVLRLDIVRQGEKIHVDKNGRVGLACSSDHWVDLGPASSGWTLTAEACQKGRSLPPGTYKNMAPRGGRLNNVEGILVVASNVRGTGLGDLLLAPRQTKVREARPEIRWTAVEGATEYVISISNLESPAIIKAAEADCGPAPGASGQKVCTHDWPGELDPGEVVFLNFGYRFNLAGPLEQDEKTGKGRRVERLSKVDEAELTRQLASLASLPWDKPERALAEAGLLARFGLYIDAIAAYEKIRQQGGKVVEITLGDLHLKVGLRRAAAYYRAVLESTDDAALQASAKFGMGRLYFALGGAENVATSRGYFLDAQKLYRSLGLAEEAAAAGDWADPSAQP